MLRTCLGRHCGAVYAVKLHFAFHDPPPARAEWNETNLPLPAAGERRMKSSTALGVVAVACWLAMPVGAAERAERFDKDPGWDGHNNRSTTPEPRTVRQDFG